MTTDCTGKGQEGGEPTETFPVAQNTNDKITVVKTRMTGAETVRGGQIWYVLVFYRRTNKFNDSLAVGCKRKGLITEFTKDFDRSNGRSELLSEEMKKIV